MNKNGKRLQEIRKIETDLTKSRVKCKCGHSIQFTKGQNYLWCSWCGTKVYRTKKIEFISIMERKLKNDIKYKRVK